MTKLVFSSCSCESCIEKCSSSPGWFKPGEAEKVAELKGISFQELFDKFLIVDIAGKHRDNTRVLSPGVVGKATGRDHTPGNWISGQCVFLKEGQCSIHEVKPYECRLMVHDGDDISAITKEVGSSWDGHRAQIDQLRGHVLAE